MEDYAIYYINDDDVFFKCFFFCFSVYPFPHSLPIYHQYQQRLIDNLIRSMLTNLTVSKFMSFGSTANDFLDVDFFRCASDKNHPDKKCM